MKLILATSNKGKIREIKELCSDYEVIAYGELIKEFEIVEDADSFKDNAIIKAKAVFNALQEKSSEFSDVIVMSDDSGISVDALNGKPGIYSARYAGENASDKDNLYKLIDDLKAINLKSSPAHYTAAIAIVTKDMQQSVHGWMYGEVIDHVQGSGGFGYDPMFIPQGYKQTLGELDGNIKKELSHRSKALKLAKKILMTK